MPDPIMFHVAGTPRPQPRPRFVKGRVISTASKPAKLWRVVVERAARDAMRALELEPFEGAVRLDVVFSFAAPASARERIGQPHTQRRDLDNLMKAIMDAMTDAKVWRDDGQVSAGLISKVWDDRSGATVRVTPIAAAVSPGGVLGGRDGVFGHDGISGWLKGSGGLPGG